MIIGEFDELGRPYLECRLIIPRLHVNQRTVFLLDTGADRTCLHPRDARRARIRVGELGGSTESRGIGGASLYYREPSLLLFDDRSYTRVYAVELLIAEPHGGSESLPSLLGRDVINHWRTEYDPTNSILACTVRHADYSLEID